MRNSDFGFRNVESGGLGARDASPVFNPQSAIRNPRFSPMLEVRNVSFAAGSQPDGEPLMLLRDISAHFPRGHLCAIVGPSGSGKSTLLKVIAGIREPEEGSIHWDGRDLAAEHDLEPHEIGYVPQFGISFDLLTVAENMENALRLRVGGLNAEARRKRAGEILKDAGLEEIADRRTGVLSGGQKRRLALAIEMATQPVLLLCDEVTSGLDTKSEDEIVQLMRRLATDGPGRTVLSVTHSLRLLELHDSVLVLYEGRLLFHGAPELLPHYFSIPGPEHLFDCLETRKPDEWAASWRKHRPAYYASLTDIETPVARAQDDPLPSPSVEETFPAKEAKGESEVFRQPAWFTQFRVLLTRQRLLLLRDRGQMFLQLALLFGFPCLVVIFAWDGLPQIANFSAAPSASALQQLLADASFSLQAVRVGGLVSGLVMFQVILLTLMGSNNSAREIAGQRAIFEKEKFAGLRTSAFLASKTVYLTVIIAAQSVWMALFVNFICQFPGDPLAQAAILFAVNAAMTSMCLGISALMKTADQASLVSVYLVGFQLPLSGAVLALPKVLGWATQPFIAGYWGWSGYLETMRDTRFYDVVQMTSRTSLAPFAICAWVLLAHILAGLVLAYFGSRESRWD
jgi:ABC-type multidrug transport system ATPase subunit